MAMDEVELKRVRDNNRSHQLLVWVRLIILAFLLIKLTKA